MTKPEPRQPDQIRAGLFKIRLVRNGPWVGAAIQHDPVCGWYALIDGIRQGDPCAEADKAPEVERIWLFGRFADEAEYRRLTRPSRELATRAPVNLASAKPVF